MDQVRRGQWLRGVLDLCVLAVLVGGESYGYEIAQRLEGAGLGAIPGGTLYPVLLRLERTGLVSAVWREGSSGPARKYYRLTHAGVAFLRRQAVDWQAFTLGVDTIMREVAAQ